MKYISSLILAALVSLSCLGAPPKLVVPEKAEVGDVVSAKLDSPAVAVEWKITDADGKPVNVIALPDGTMIFGSGASARKITVLAAVAYKDGEAVKAALVQGTVTVGTPQPGPQPQPQPTPEPDTKFGLTKSVKGWATGGDAKGWNALSESFRLMKSQIAAGRFSRYEDVLVATAQNNRAALANVGLATSAYEPFFVQLQKALHRMYQDGKLTTLDDLAVAWDEISNGLKR